MLDRMKIKLLLFFFGFIPFSFGQSIFENAINGTNPGTLNPYTIGQSVDPNITVSGIARGSGLNGNVGNDRYNTRDWNLLTIDPDDYIEFTISPSVGYKVSFINFVYKAQVSTTGPRQFSFRSSVDGFASNVNLPVIPNSASEETPLPIDLTAANFQNVTSPITFRIYAWGGTATTGTFSINEFSFNGIVACDLAVPTIGTVVHPTCTVPTGSIQLNNLPATGSWNLYQNGSLIVAGGTGASTTVSGLSSGSYSYNVVNLYCSSLATANVTINPITTSWDGTTWSSGAPDINKAVVFNGNYTSVSDIDACSCQVLSGAVTINSSHSLTVVNGVAVAGGSLSFEDGASLVQINDLALNSGNITYKRFTTAVSNFDYTYWSSPVFGQILYDVSPLTLLDKFYSFNSFTNNWQQENVSGSMLAGTGYIIRGPQTHMSPAPPSTYEVGFVGSPHNGVASVSIGGAGNSVLVGNPYPSAIDADAFIAANSAVIDGTLYFWTHNTSIQLASNIANGTAGSGTYAYTSDDYAVYNLSGGVGTAPAASSGNAGSVSTLAPSGKIAAGQAFFTSSIGSGNVVFNNNMRLGGGGSAGNNSQFFKMASNTKKNKTIERNRLWLELFNNQGAYKQTMIGYISGATNDYDNAFDSESYNANAYLDFYSIIKDKNVVIQGRALPFVDEDEVAIGFSTKVAGAFEIAISKTDGLLINKEVYLKDNVLNTVHNLKTKPYCFTTEKGVFNQRFVILYAGKVLATAKLDASVSGVVIATKNKEIEVKSADELIDKVYVYDFSGKLIYTKTKISNRAYKIEDLISRGKFLIVKVVLENGIMVNKKVMY